MLCIKCNPEGLFEAVCLESLDSELGTLLFDFVKGVK